MNLVNPLQNPLNNPQGQTQTNQTPQNLGSFNLPGIGGMSGQGFSNPMHDNYMYGNLAANNPNLSHWINQLKNNNNQLSEAANPEQALQKINA